MGRESVSWWLDWSALPDRYLWARLTVYDEGSTEVLDCDGRTHKFGDATSARNWLLEDEYSLLEQLKANGDVPSNILAPHWA